MNEAHKVCGGDEWRAMIRHVILPKAIGDTALGDDVLGDGRFTGAACFTLLHHLRTAELHRALRPGAPLVAGDNLASPEMEVGHVDDTCNPIDPATLPARLEAAGFHDVEVSTNPFAWSLTARA